MQASRSYHILSKNGKAGIAQATLLTGSILKSISPLVCDSQTSQIPW